MLLVIGTSGVVYPAALIPQIARRKGAIIVEVNIEKTPITSIADIHLEMPAGEALGRIVSEVKRLAALPA